jgi:glycosidase
MALYFFPVSRAARERYALSRGLFSSTGNIVFLDLHAARLFTQAINTARAASADPRESLRAGDMNAMGLIDEILHYVVGLYVARANPQGLSRALRFVQGSLGTQAVDSVLERYVAEFPPPGADDPAAYLAGRDGDTPHREIVLQEILLLSLSNTNPAFSPFKELFDHAPLAADTPYAALQAATEEFFAGQPPFGPDGQDLLSMLRSPMRAAPLSLAGQLEYIRTRWGALLGDLLLRLLTGIDLIREEEKLRFGTFTPGPPEVYEYVSQAAEVEAFSSDTEWMPRTVMLAKNALVWLDQLSRAHGREIRRLDQVPDAELDRMAAAGFTALWLIGVWERSAASREIKRRMGNPDAEASAYSLYDYIVAAELGGQGSLEDLRARAARRGIRLASDMVPNHTGVDSRWMAEHPERFLAWPHPWPPFPSYSYNGPNVSSVPGLSVQLEDHYWDKTDAAVVFKRVDTRSGDTRLIYHGNDGTHMPWNDTAQLDFLNPATREAVIQTILHVARQFPIIRFDAAMTLAKKHFQRLWYPEPGRGGDIPSRAGNGLSRHDFDRAMPAEFWREVVDRVAREAPGTLLLAEAFWMLEGFFVRTLGMHRVYNSAFMHMLKAEDNAGYRQTIRNTLEFDPEVLKRFVNFMSNPDEQTAIEQFGDGDKYFGVCTLMATLPGLPLFAHGQLEGLKEKYGMEFRRAYWHEQGSTGLMERHEREIFPLLRKRYLFSGVESFLLYDFYAPDGRVNEDVFAYSNRNGGERGLVLYNNRYADARGWARTSAAFAVRTAEGRTLTQKCLGEGLSLPDDPTAWAVFREHFSGLQFIRNCRELWEKGMYAELGAYRCQLFMDFSVVYDDAGRRWSSLAAELAGRGVPSIDAAFRERQLRPLHAPFAALLARGPRDEDAAAAAGAEEPADLDALYAEFLRAAGVQAPGLIDEAAGLESFRALCRAPSAAMPAPAAGEQPASGGEPARAFTWLWTVLRPLCPAEPPASRIPSWVEEWMLGGIMGEHLVRRGWEASAARHATALLSLAVHAEEIRAGGDDPAGEKLFSLPAAEDFLLVNLFGGTRWFSREALELMADCLRAVETAGTPRGDYRRLLVLAEDAGYRWEPFLASVAAPAELP